MISSSTSHLHLASTISGIVGVQISPVIAKMRVIRSGNKFAIFVSPEFRKKIAVRDVFVVKHACLL